MRRAVTAAAAITATALLATGCNNGQSSTAPNGGLDAGGQSCEYVMPDNNNESTVKVLLDGISYCAEGSAMLKDYGGPEQWAPVLYAPVPVSTEVCSLTQQTIHIRVYNMPNTSKPASVAGQASILCSSLRNNGWR